MFVTKTPKHTRDDWKGMPMQQKFAKAQMGQSNEISSCNYTDGNGNPAGGYATGVGLCVAFQNGPRGKDASGALAPANGAFVEDLLVAAHQRLEFFQGSKFVHEDNAEAMRHIEAAIEALNRRAKERAKRGVLGQNSV